MFWNDGRARFHDISPITGLQAAGSWRSLVVGDLDRDGRPDLVVGGHDRHPRVYLNRVAGPLPPIGFSFVGSTSNPLGLGALVEVVVDGESRPLQVVGAVESPGPMSEPLVFEAAGPDGVVDRVRVTWPSGHVQEVLDLQAGAVHRIEEPPVLVVEPGNRWVARGEPVRLTATPRQVDGTPRSDALVTIERLAGAEVSWDGPVEADGEGWKRTVTAPAAGESTVFVVTVDGVAMGVRPRVWWREE